MLLLGTVGQAAHVAFEVNSDQSLLFWRLLIKAVERHYPNLTDLANVALSQGDYVAASVAWEEGHAMRMEQVLEYAQLACLTSHSTEIW